MASRWHAIGCTTVSCRRPRRWARWAGGIRNRPQRTSTRSKRARSANRRAQPRFEICIAEFDPETIRFFLLSTHYRRPIDFSEERIREVGAGLATFYRFLKRYERIGGESFYQIAPPARRAEGEFDPGDDPGLKAIAEQRSRFLEAMDDDFNTGGAIGVLFELLRMLNKYADDEKLEEPSYRDATKLAALQQGAKTLRELGATLGLFLKPPQEAAKGDDALVGKLLALLIEVRADARKAKNFAAADKVRARLAEIGVTLEDRPSGTEWTIER